jgi:hypothetical protein
VYVLVKVELPEVYVDSYGQVVTKDVVTSVTTTVLYEDGEAEVTKDEPYVDALAVTPPETEALEVEMDEVEGVE